MKRYPVVILHGWGLAGTVFEPLKRELAAKGYRVYAPDMPGFGSAPLPDRPMTVADYAENLSGFLKKENIRQPVLIGHSFGGRVAIRYSSQFAGNVRALVLTGTPGYKSAAPVRLTIAKLVAVAGNAVLSLPFLTPVKAKARDFLYRAVGARDFARASGVMKETFKLVVDEDLKNPMLALRVPSLLIWGEGDTVVPVSVARRMRDTIPGSILVVVPGEDHRVPYRNPGVFAAETEKFLSSLDPRA